MSEFRVSPVYQSRIVVGRGVSCEDELWLTSLIYILNLEKGYVNFESKRE
jgi:hypothetical protein